MAREHVRLGTTGYETSIAGEDVHKRLIVAQGFNEGTPTTSVEFIAKSDCVVTINGFTSTVPSGTELTIRVDDQAGGVVKSFVTETADVEFILSMTF